MGRRTLEPSAEIPTLTHPKVDIFMLTVNLEMETRLVAHLHTSTAAMAS